MNPINLSGFAGSNLAINPRLLAESVGVNVTDAEPGYGDLRPLHMPLVVATVPTSPQRNTIYREGRDLPNDALYWMNWSAVVSVIRGFDGNDTTERIYYTGNGTPKWTDNVKGLGTGAPYPQAERELSVPAPANAPTLSLTTDGTGTLGTRFYVSTFVNDIGWESAPSAVSIGLTCKPGAIVALSNLPPAPSGAYGITLRRVYRTEPGTTGTAAFQFLIELPIGTTSTTDDARSLLEVLPTTGWLPPPAAAFGLISLWNGMTAAIVGKNIIFCEPTNLYAWPVKYDFAVQNTPVALAKWEQNLLVLTTGAPVLLQGQNPASMSETPAAMSAPCRTMRGVVEFKHGVVWPSNEGLAYSGSPVLLTQHILTPRQWRAIRPETIVAGRWQRFYVASYDDGTGTGLKGFMFDPLAPAQGIWWLSAGFNACWYDELADALYVLQGGNVCKFDGSATLMTAKFTTKQFLQTTPRNFGWAKVVADAYPITVRVYADRVLKITKTVMNANPFTLLSGFLALDWQIEVESSLGSIQAVRLATHVKDFKNL